MYRKYGKSNINTHSECKQLPVCVIRARVWFTCVYDDDSNNNNNNNNNTALRINNNIILLLL